MQSNSDKPNESNLNHNPLLGDGEQFSKSEMAPEMMKVKKSCLASLNLINISIVSLEGAQRPGFSFVGVLELWYYTRIIAQIPAF